MAFFYQKRVSILQQWRGAVWLVSVRTHVKTGHTAQRESTSEEEVSWRRGRRWFSGWMNDEVWKHLRMTEIPDLAESPELGPTNRIWRNSSQNIELRVN